MLAYAEFIPPIAEWAAWLQLVLVAAGIIVAVLAAHRAGKDERATLLSICSLLLLLCSWPLVLALGREPDVDAPRVKAADVENLFYSPKINVGDGVLDVDCKPTSDPSGLGSPWSCKLETDSSGNLTWRVRLTRDGQFSAEDARPACCIRVRRR